MNIFAIIAAGGVGSRCPGSVPKQFQNLGDQSVIDWSIEAMLDNKNISGVIAVVPAAYAQAVKDMYLDEPKFLGAIPGGESRQESVYNALNALSTVAEDEDAVLIHDAARPGLSEDLLQRCVDAVKVYPAIVAVLPTTDTLYKVEDGKIVEVINRSAFRSAQTPQGFNFGRIMKAFDKAVRSGDFGGSDDVAVYRKYGTAKQVRLVDGCAQNFKITTEQDFEIARALFEAVENE